MDNYLLTFLGLDCNTYLNKEQSKVVYDYIQNLLAENQRQKETISRLEEWISGIADDHPQIPEWIQQSAKSLLAQGAE